ncbi:MAG: BrnT family toxin [Deltaproteobacteria bacterium]|nr:BrnT family toxin [Deltaproteobacteria bacterium]
MFEWDEAKRLKTLKDRDLDFKDTWQVFDGRPVLHLPSWRNNESCFVSVSEINGDLYTVVWAWRGENRRIISFRRARNAEKRAYRKAHG